MHGKRNALNLSTIFIIITLAFSILPYTEKIFELSSMRESLSKFPIGMAPYRGVSGPEFKTTPPGRLTYSYL